MYDPVKDGVEKSAPSMTYIEVDPPAELADLVHCYWEMKTDGQLTADFELHALPDACVNVLFDQHDTSIAGVTALHTSHTTLNLGRAFHYLGVQFFPGVWRHSAEGTVDHYVGEPYEGELPLVATSQALLGLDMTAKQTVLTNFVSELLADEVIARNQVTAAILTEIGDITSVADMARLAALSPRQLQRTLKETTGFSPHDFLKVLRLQHSFRQDYLLSFTDQSHYTHSFKKLTGYTPGQFQKKFDV